MKKIIAFFALAVLISSCEMGVSGNGKVKTEKRNVEKFNRIEVSGSFDVHIRQGETAGITIKADENLMELIETSVHNDELKIKSKKSIRRAKELALYITVRELEKIEASGACTIVTDGELRSAKLEIESSGACEANMDLRCDELKVNISGAGDLTFRGVAESFEVESSGACEISAFDLKTLRTRIDISGAGEVDVYVTEELKVDASGAAEVRYKGNPRNINQDASGASSVKPYN
ncbi:MAG: head GIN domain-containing protein [Owenweeksia sp.]